MKVESLLTPEEAAARLGQAPATLGKWRSERRGPKYVKIGRRCLYRPEDVEAYLESRLVDPAQGRAA